MRLPPPPDASPFPAIEPASMATGGFALHRGDYDQRHPLFNATGKAQR